jgi:MinD superfamily P-loop ATPase
MKELVVISGKGGTGKTSLVASFAVLARNQVLADCDVDAADLHLILAPKIQRTEAFRSGHQAVIRQPDCIQCGACLAHCRFKAVKMDGPGAGKATFTIDPTACEGCGVCVRFCPAKAIDFPERLCGEWYVSETRCGPMVHARLGIAAENSGKLVSLVRREARSLAERERGDLLLVDGPPGLGCPVIASLTGASLALVVTEPTCSGEHDFSRLAQLVNHFKLPAALCVNKADINPEQAGQIETRAREYGWTVLNRIRYDPAVTRAQVQGHAVVEEASSPAAADIRSIWGSLRSLIDTQPGSMNR